jgi:hypothetical protein
MGDATDLMEKHVEDGLGIIWRVSFIISLNTAVVMGSTSRCGLSVE